MEKYMINHEFEIGTIADYIILLKVRHHGYIPTPLRSYAAPLNSCCPSVCIMSQHFLNQHAF